MQISPSQARPACRLRAEHLLCPLKAGRSWLPGSPCAQYRPIESRAGVRRVTHDARTISVHDPLFANFQSFSSELLRACAQLWLQTMNIKSCPSLAAGESLVGTNANTVLLA